MTPKYPRYKDSGIPWIGEIPEGWKITQVKQIFNIGRGRVISQLELDDEGSYPVYSSQTQNNGCLGYIKTYDFDVSQLTWTTDGANAGTVFLREGKHNCTNVCGTLQSKDKNVNLKYMLYDLIHTAYYHKRQDTNGYKIMNNEMASIKICMPNLSEQKAIADYLDEKCDAIDKIIETEEKVIEKLKEYKQSLITETVTKGLDKSAPMKDSGLPWIGQIPQHWEMKRLKNVLVLRNQKTQPKGQTYIALEHINSYTGTYSLQEKIVPEGVSNAMRKGDILFAKLRPYLAKAIIVEFDGICSSEFLVMKNYKGASSFLLRVLLSHWFINLVSASTYGTKMPRANWQFIGNMEIPFPPKAEQQSIADYLDNKCAKIDKAIADKEQVIEKLTEYKKSLIYECVTGKRMVA